MRRVAIDGFMRSLTFFLLLTMLFRIGSLPAAERSGCGGDDGACRGTQGANILSMMVWGMGLGAGIAVLCGLLDQDTANAH